MEFVVSVGISVLIFGLVLVLLLRVKTPRYKVTEVRVKTLLEQVLVGQANPNDWRVFIAFQIRDNPALETIRLACQELDENEYRSQGEYILSARGRARVAELLTELNAERHN